jgi:hypothetical protein
VVCENPLVPSLRGEATALLDEGLRDLLTSYGGLIEHGSYALDLMTWRNLDLYLVLEEMNTARFFELGGRLASLLQPRKMNFRDERAATEKSLPAGLYWGLYAGEWKIDLWAVDAEEARRLMEFESALAARLTDESRRIILAVKSAVCMDQNYRRTFGAKEVYAAVLDGGVRDEAGFRRYLRERLHAE